MLAPARVELDAIVRYWVDREGTRWRRRLASPDTLAAMRQEVIAFARSRAERSRLLQLALRSGQEIDAAVRTDQFGNVEVYAFFRIMPAERLRFSDFRRPGGNE